MSAISINSKYVWNVSAHCLPNCWYQMKSELLMRDLCQQMLGLVKIPFHKYEWIIYKMICPPLLVERIKTRKIVENETLFTYLPFERQDSGKEKKKVKKKMGERRLRGGGDQLEIKWKSELKCKGIELNSRERIERINWEKSIKNATSSVFCLFSSEQTFAASFFGSLLYSL